LTHTGRIVPAAGSAEIAMDNVEMAQDSFEKAHEHAAHGAAHAVHSPPASTRLAAVLVAILAAVAVIVEMSANDQQTAYLAHYVSATDLWSQYQGKSVRHAVMSQSAAILDSLSPPSHAGAEAARDAAARLENDPGHDGMRQLSERAHHEEAARDTALHLHEGLERSVRGLQIAIVLVGLFMATRQTWLLGIGAVLGGFAILYGLVTGLALI